MNKLLTAILCTLAVTTAWAENYEKITSSNSLTSGIYLIVYEGGNVALNGGLTTLDAKSNFISVIISNKQEILYDFSFSYLKVIFI